MKDGYLLKKRIVFTGLSRRWKKTLQNLSSDKKRSQVVRTMALQALTAEETFQHHGNIAGKAIIERETAIEALLGRYKKKPKKRK